MRYVPGLNQLRALHAELVRDGTLVVIGNFDGVHRGHQAVLRAALQVARERGLHPLVLTFHPHPAEVLGRGQRVVLTALPRRVELLLRLDPTLKVVVEPFGPDLARMSPERFTDLLVQDLGAKLVLVGQNFRFGKDRAGDLQALQRLGRVKGFEARAEELLGDESGAYSSTRVRAALQRGEVELVCDLLGRPHAIAGEVMHGDGRGRSIGVPTANLGSIVEAVPADGVYACLIDRIDSGRALALARGVANLGVRPTVAGGPSVEAHLLDFSGDLYGARLRLHFVRRLRSERRFPTVEELVAQIRRDVTVARGELEAWTPDPSAEGAWA